ncbi:hypothetical protein DE146DRAFT_254334 [Phaeosphaeria sp. MPI-PUGE-AT-0046c]|nr:hypothetical protein DE146DRAFT_254334 [Phaeosphaeria sp. MPI-PUGE-AT-0046c]
MARLFSTLLILASALVAHAGIQATDFSGVGKIYVLKSDSWSTASPKEKVGCLDDHGKFVHAGPACGTFSRRPTYPYTLSTAVGNCTFDDESQERNTDSTYGTLDYAWSCKDDHNSQLWDEFYTIDGFPYIFLCFGDFACYYDAKKAPSPKDVLPLWQYRWGSQQMGITPGHVQLQLMWEKMGDLPKREGESKIPSPRIRIEDGMQIPLGGAATKG